ncbi:hypothetical protein BJY01DRAFT_210474 [Aspergillus pseudoustus]|uniref:SAM-like domain-containing protein n=1 Tax=Aspergillus pseudoustus TaxID=1810923 RepID=A0ABR4KB75_9EURO
MAVLRKDMQTGGSGNGNSISSLSQFVEMSSEERRKLFRRLLGENVLRRVDSLIEQDWHCDWALDFEGTEE